MRVQDICQHDVITIGPQEGVGRAAELMRQHHVGNVIVVGHGTGRPVPLGILTDRDLVVGVLAREVPNPLSLKVEDVLGRSLYTVQGAATLEEARVVMLSHGVRRLPVVDAEGFLIGILSFDDLIHQLSSELHDLSRLFVLGRRRETGRRPA